MQRYIQYPDLTELSGISFGEKDAASTEFVFAVAAPRQDTKLIEDMGLTHVASMMNWWPSHWGQARELKLFWGRGAKGKRVVPNRYRWCHDPNGGGHAYITKDLAASGCGVKLGTLPLKRASFFRYFTLLRLPLELNKMQQAWLKKNYFRHLETGGVADYWVNGWAPGTWTIEKEYERFHGYEEKQADKDLASYGYKPL